MMGVIIYVFLFEVWKSGVIGDVILLSWRGLSQCQEHLPSIKQCYFSCVILTIDCFGYKTKAIGKRRCGT